MQVIEIFLTSIQEALRFRYLIDSVARPKRIMPAMQERRFEEQRVLEFL